MIGHAIQNRLNGEQRDFCVVADSWCVIDIAADFSEGVSNPLCVFAF